MPGETRVALLPENVRTLRHPEQLFFEAGYAVSLGIADGEYARLGANLVPRSAIRHMDVLCVPRFSESDGALFQDGMTLWGWPYIEDNPWCARAVVEHALTVVDFHFMYSDGQFVFRENSRLAGRLGIMHAMVMGRPPERFGKTAVIGKGHLGSGATGILDGFGVRYRLFDRSNSGEFLRSVEDFDTIVNCIKWAEEGFFIAREHIARMKEGAFIIDLSTEGIEDSMPQPAHAPVYRDGRVLIYSNDHIPAMWPVLASAQISKALLPYIDMMVEGCPNPALETATIVTAGQANAATGKLARMALERASPKSPGYDAVSYRSIPLRKFEKSPGFFGAMATRRISRGAVVVSLRGFAPVKERSQYSIQIDQFHHLDTRDPGKRCFDDFINHGCSPNLFFDVCTLEIRALRDIEPGEEVLLNYCATEEELPEPFTCNCGSPDCYGVVSGFRFLARSRQEALKGMASPWLRTKYGL